MSTRVITYAGPPTASTGEVADVAVDINAITWVCTIAGSPGTWVKANAGSLVPIASSVLSAPAASIDFSAISQAYNHLVLRFIGETDRASNADALSLRFNADSAAHYEVNGVTTSGSSAPVNGQATGQDHIGVTLAGNLQGAANPSIAEFEILGYALTTFGKNVLGKAGMGGGGNAAFADIVGTWNQTSAITEVTLASANGANFKTGSGAWLYGVV